jgi:hypothetical protein
MRVDRRWGSGGGREPEELRAILRQWKVPRPPREIEDDLRRTFRKRRDRRPRLLWLAVAASVALLLAYQVKPPGRPALPVVPERPMTRTPSPPPVVETHRHDTPGPPPRTRRAAVAPPVEDAVIVEPRQAELLAQLARQLKGVRQALPGVSLPRIEAVPAGGPPPQVRAAREGDTLLQYNAHWEKVGNEWPFLHRSL